MISPTTKQTWVVTGVLLNMLGQGILMGHTSILLPSVQAPESDIKVDIQTASVIASAIGITGVPGFLLSSLSMELLGRRLAHGLAIIPSILGWLCIYFAKSVPLLVFGRALGGFTSAATVFLGAMVIGEYASPKNRGIFLNLKTAAVCCGNMLTHMLGHFYSWRTIALFGVLPHFASILITCTWPESPAWLASKQKYNQCETSFLWLRGNDEKSTKELEELLRAQKEKTAKELKNLTLYEKIVQFLIKFKSKDFIVPVAIVLFGFLLFEACGRHILPSFALQIIEQITGNKEQLFYYTLGMDVTITASALFSSAFIKLFNRRTLLFGSGFASLFTLYSLCCCLYILQREVISSDTKVVPILLFVMYIIVSNLGCTCIPLVLLGEIFPLAHRGFGSCIGGVLMSISIMTAMFVTPYLLMNARVYGMFAIYGAVMGLSLTALWFILPETKDRTLQEIEDYLNCGEYKHKVLDDQKSGPIPD